MTTREELLAAFKLIDKVKLPVAAYAELANEEDPDGAVLLKDEKGHVVMAMPRDVWDALQKDQ